MAERQMVVVTGGMGYIGSHTVVELSSAGYDVLIIDNLSNSRASVLEGIRSLCATEVLWENIDLRDQEATEAVFAKYDNILGSIHFAAFKAVGESVRDPLKYYDNNINSLLNVLHAHNKFNIPNLIFSSSCTVYGQAAQLPVTEDSPVVPAFSPYGETKQICEKILTDYTHAHTNTRAISLRYFNPIGAHDSCKIGELPLGKPENLLPYITQTAAGLRDQLSVFGNDYNTADGTAIRDYIHVVDLAKAHVVALNRLVANANKKAHEFYNLGTGKGFSVLDVINSFEKTTGIKVNYQIVDRRPGDVEAVYADTSLSEKELNWKAELGLDDMTLSAWNWEKKLRDLD